MFLRFLGLFYSLLNDILFQFHFFFLLQLQHNRTTIKTKKVHRIWHKSRGLASPWSGVQPFSLRCANPKICDAFLRVTSVWWFHLRSFEVWTPSSRLVSTWPTNLICWLQIFFVFVNFVGTCDVHFSAFNSMPLFSHHAPSLV
jgi:hypothetical protein